MEREEVFTGSVEKIEVIDGDGETSLEDDEIVEIYKQMMIARKFDEKAFALQRRGEVSTYAPHKGQEAAQVGAVEALSEEDWIVPSFRETAAFIARGAPLDKVFQRWMGDANGQKGLKELNTLPVAIPVGTQNLHTAGLGMSMKKKDEENAVIGFTGDGSTSEGDFHEALNFAGVFDAHSVFFVQNNRYAISLPVEKQTNSDTIAQKALGYGIKGIQVDGNDALAVFEAVKEALEKARNGNPVLVEALTYRLEDHTTSDDSTRYRDEDEVEEWKEHDPLERLRSYMAENDIWTEELEEFEEEAKQKIQEAAETAIEMDEPEMEEMFEYVYKNMPPQLAEQMEEIRGETQ